MLLIFFYIRNNIKNLKLSLESLFSFSDKNVDIHIFCDNCNEEIGQVLQNFDFSKKNIHLTKTNKVLGIDYFISNNLFNTKGEYVWIIDGIVNVNSLNKISKEIEDSTFDVICFNSAKTKVVESDAIEKNSFLFKPIFVDKLFSLEFLKKNIAFFNSFSYLSFFYKVFSVAKRFSFLEEKVIATTNIDFQQTLDIHKTFILANDFLINYSQANFWKNNKILLEGLFVYFFINVFWKQINVCEKNKVIRQIYFNGIKNFLTQSFPNWKNNQNYFSSFNINLNEWK